MISILPRAIAGVAGYFILHGLTKVSGGKSKDIIRALSAGLTVFLHTVLVLGAMEIFYMGGAFMDTVWGVIIGLNFVSELICAVVLVPALIRIMKKYTKTPDIIPLKGKE